MRRRNWESDRKALQLAKALHNLSPLDGEACTNCNSMAEYEALFQSLCNSQCAGGIGNQIGRRCSWPKPCTICRRWTARLAPIVTAWPSMRRCFKACAIRNAPEELGIRSEGVAVGQSLAQSVAAGRRGLHQL